MILRRSLIVAASLAALLGYAAQPAPLLSAPAAQAQSPAGLPLVPLKIRSGRHVHRFTVEVAVTPEQQARGLMFRPRVGPNEGMIFPMAPPRITEFWMVNCPAPLDMIFIRPDGTIARIAVNTTPYSDEPISSYEPVASVLELAGGRTVELGIKANDRVTWRRP